MEHPRPGARRTAGRRPTEPRHPPQRILVRLGRLQPGCPGVRRPVGLDHSVADPGQLTKQFGLPGVICVVEVPEVGPPPQ